MTGWVAVPILMTLLALAAVLATARRSPGDALGYVVVVIGVAMAGVIVSLASWLVWALLS